MDTQVASISFIYLFIFIYFLKTVQNQGDIGHIIIIIINSLEMGYKQEAVIQTHLGIPETTQADVVKCTERGGSALSRCTETWMPQASISLHSQAQP